MEANPESVYMQDKYNIELLFERIWSDKSNKY